MIITMEGFTGSGKSTQCQILAEKYGLSWRRPYGYFDRDDETCFLERAIPHLLNLFPRNLSYAAKNAYALFTQRAAQDCWADDIIFEHYLDGLVFYEPREAEAYAKVLYGTDSIKPDLSIILHLNSEERLRRKIHRDYGGQDISFFETRERQQSHFEKVERTFALIAEVFPYPVEFVDASGTIEEVTNACVALIDQIVG